MFVWSVLSAVKWFVCVFFFFKQKTAYEMRISDWSSDVCSSDLRALCLGPASRHRKGTRGRSQRAWRGCRAAPLPPAGPDSGGDGNRRLACRISSADVVDRLSARPRGLQDDPRFRRNSAEPGAAAPAAGADGRSEEHTSELQSLMRISYAVFCLKKKHNINIVLPLLLGHQIDVYTLQTSVH